MFDHQQHRAYRTRSLTRKQYKTLSDRGDYAWRSVKHQGNKIPDKFLSINSL